MTVARACSFVPRRACLAVILASASLAVRVGWDRLGRAGAVTSTAPDRCVTTAMTATVTVGRPEQPARDATGACQRSEWPWRSEATPCGVHSARESVATGPPPAATPVEFPLSPAAVDAAARESAVLGQRKQPALIP